MDDLSLPQQLLFHLIMHQVDANALVPAQRRGPVSSRVRGGACPRDAVPTLGRRRTRTRFGICDIPLTLWSGSSVCGSATPITTTPGPLPRLLLLTCSSEKAPVTSNRQTCAPFLETRPRPHGSENLSPERRPVLATGL